MTPAARLWWALLTADPPEGSDADTVRALALALISERRPDQLGITPDERAELCSAMAEE